MHLVMMVKNEADTIARTLESVPWVSGATIVDTGSTDRTLEMAAGCWSAMVNASFVGFAPGLTLHHLPWPGRFDKARNDVLALAHRDALGRGPFLLLDAGEVWQGAPPEGKAGRVVLTYGDGWVWWQHRVVLPGARYQGAVHETITGKGLDRAAPFVGRILCAEPNTARWVTDAQTLAADKSHRGVFYRAMTLMSLGRKASARKAFIQRLAMGATNDSEEHECYESMMRLATCDAGNVVGWLEEAAERAPHRAEPPWFLAEHFARKDWGRCYSWAARGMRATRPRDYLFLYEPAYGDAPRDLAMRAARHVGLLDASRAIARDILTRRPRDPVALLHAD